MSHKDAPPLTPEQERFEAFYRANVETGTTIGFGRSKTGAYLSSYASLAWKAWQEARRPEQEDASKWRALIGCARLRWMGAAGLHDESPELNSPRAHLGLEMWTHHEAATEPLTLTLLERFIAKVRKL